ncbi:MAG: hypothetical protein MUC36_16880 [Planctomycetes bacterium]|jgi:hypothetical protein|nr:hypothetical protein [Planctomycetota bacterium]
MITHPVFGGLRHFTAVALLASAALAQVPFTIGNVVVVRVGDGAAALSSAATATFLDEYTPAGTFVQTIAMPTVASGLNQPFTNAGSSTSEGFLNVSDNGLFLLLAGYSAAPGTPAVPTTTSITTPRVIARVDLSASIDTSTTLPDAYNGTPAAPPITSFNGNPRAAASSNGIDIWTSGNGTAGSNGVRYVTFGGNSSVGLNLGAPGNTRVVSTYNGNLYTSSASTVNQGVCQVGTGLPTTAGQAVTLLPGFPTAAGPSSYDFYFANPSTLYVADDRAQASGGGIQKWALAAGTWTLQYTLSGGTGYRGLTGQTVAGVTTLWATNGNALVSVVDTGAGSTFTSLVSAPSNTAFRGVRRLGKPTTLQRITASCGAADIFSSGTGEVGTDVITTVLNPLGIPLIGYGLSAIGFPALPGCSCVFVHNYAFVVVGSPHVLSLPNQPALAGTQLWIQAVDFVAPGGCNDPLLTLTDGYTFLIQ